VSDSLALSLLEAHRVTERGRASARESRVRLRADHVVTEGESAGLVLRLFETLGRERTAVELALVAAESDALGIDQAAAWERTEAAARRRGVVCSRPGNGAVHQVYLARFAAPGRLVFGTSERLAACGALGCLALSASAVEAAAALAGAPVEFSWPEILHVRLFGKPARWVAGDDVALELERRLAFAPVRGSIVEYQVFEPDALPVEDRIAISARAPQLSAVSSLFDSDVSTRAFLAAHGRESDWRGLGGAVAEPEEHLVDLDFSNLEPLAAAPGADGVLRLRELGDARVSLVWIGPEASRLDLERFARALDGAHLPDAVQGFVSFGNRRDHETAVRSGVLAALYAAGMRVTTRPSAMPRPRAEAGMGLACGAPGARLLGWHEVGVAACVAGARTAAVTDPRQLEMPELAAIREGYVIDDRLIERPASGVAASATGVEPVAHAAGIQGPLRGSVLLALGDHVGTDRILPWGARARPASLDPDRLARLAFSGVDPLFAARAVAEGGGWIVAGRGFGERPAREQAVLVLANLGVRGVLARSFDATFRTLLRQHGVLALRFAAEADGLAIRPGDELEIPDLPEGLEPGKPLVVRNLTQGSQYTLHHDLDAAGVREVRAGGLLAALEIDAVTPA